LYLLEALLLQLADCPTALRSGRAIDQQRALRILFQFIENRRKLGQWCVHGVNDVSAPVLGKRSQVDGERVIVIEKNDRSLRCQATGSHAETGNEHAEDSNKGGGKNPVICNEASELIHSDPIAARRGP
jgi:hypothetical protein